MLHVAQLLLFSPLLPPPPPTGLHVHAHRHLVMGLRDRNREQGRAGNEVRHRSKMIKRRAASHAARDARSQPLPGRSPRTAAGDGFGDKRRLAAEVPSRRRGRRRLSQPTPGFKGPPPPSRGGSSGYTRTDDARAPDLPRPPRGQRCVAPVNEELVEAVLAQRARAREAGDYASADRLRAVLRAMGVEVMDDVRAWRCVGRQRASARDLLFLELLFRGLARYRGESL